MQFVSEKPAAAVRDCFCSLRRGIYRKSRRRVRRLFPQTDNVRVARAFARALVDGGREGHLVPQETTPGDARCSGFEGDGAIWTNASDMNAWTTMVVGQLSPKKRPAAVRQRNDLSTHSSTVLPSAASMRVSVWTKITQLPGEAYDICVRELIW